jgi:hypothetical protein
MGDSAATGIDGPSVPEIIPIVISFLPPSFLRPFDAGHR